MKVEEKEGPGILLETVIGSFTIGYVVCQSCGKQVIGAIGGKGLATLLHVEARGNDCPGSCQSANRWVTDPGERNSFAEVVSQPANLLAEVA